jgi:hypothetical protein
VALGWTIVKVVGLVAVVGAGLAFATPAKRFAAPVRTPAPEFHWPRPPLAGAPTQPRRSIHIRGLGLGKCAFSSAGQTKLMTDAASAAALLSKEGRRAAVTVRGGADGTPIKKLSPACAALAPAPETDPNVRLARSRAAYAKRLFLSAFAKAGGNPASLDWTEAPPSVTANIDQPSDRNVLMTMVWRASSPENANASINKRTP